MNGRYCTACGGMDYSEMGDVPCACLFPEQPQPGPGDECEGRGHPYYGDDVMQGEHGDEPVGRCYCGKRPYPPGGGPT